MNHYRRRLRRAWRGMFALSLLVNVWLLSRGEGGAPSTPTAGAGEPGEAISAFKPVEPPIILYGGDEISENPAAEGGTPVDSRASDEPWLFVYGEEGTRENIGENSGEPGMVLIFPQDGTWDYEYPLPDGAEIDAEWVSEGEDSAGEEDLLLLVNAWNPLPEGYRVRLKSIGNGQAVAACAYDSLMKMMADARAAGLSPLICSSYRTLEKQKNLFENRVQRCLSEGYRGENAENEAAKWVARPGTSEHHTGLAVDIVALSYQLLDEGQERTAEQQWLMKNSWKYGFILRYPNQKSALTGIHYEPWHYRYVGFQAAKEITERGICLEEYLSEYPK